MLAEPTHPPNRLFLTALCALLVASLLIAGSSLAQEQPTTIILPSLTLGAGENATVEALIDCAADGCSAFDLTLVFDPAILRVERAEIGPYLGDEVFVVENEIDNDAGTVRLAAAVLGDMPAPVSDILFTLGVTGLAEGETALIITDLLVGDLVGNRVEAQGIDGLIAVGEAGMPTPTPAPADSPTPIGTPEPCFVRTDQPYVAVRVGPGENRGVRSSLPVNTDIPVVGQATDGDGNLWWQIHPRGYSEAEADRYWVLAEDVETVGNCATVTEVDPSPVVVNPSAITTETGSPIPTINSITIQGNCSSYTTFISWSDSDGDAIRLEITNNIGGVSARGISGTGGTYVWANRYCPGTSCADQYRIVDQAGNQSTRLAPRIYCE